MQQMIRTAKGSIHAKLTIPGSSNISLRAILLSALADGVSEISGLLVNENTHLFINALYQLGIVTQLDEKSSSCIIAGGNGKFPKKQATLWCGNSSAIARFLLTACASTPGVYYFDGAKPLRKKSFLELISVLRRQGAQVIPNEINKLPFTLVGADSLEGGEIVFEEAVVSQLVSALLMIAPYARSSFSFTILDALNQPRLDMTCTMMAEFGVLVHRIHQGQFMVPVPQRYQARDYVVEPDFSIAAYFFAAAALSSGEVTIQPTKRTHSKQTAIKFLSVLETMGCRVLETHAGLTVKGPAELHGIEVSMHKIADTLLTLLALAPFAKSPTRITDTGFMHKKQAKQLKAMKTELTKLGVRIETGKNYLEIFPSLIQGGVVESHDDPRIAMALSIIGVKVPGIIINDAECVNAVVPDFFMMLDKLSEQLNISA